eukprot:m.1223100 g.1223100  ORF g.1223100 m.1223100 type:complete len:67 (+) comp24625_c0_seq11:4298-4498(+)
MKCETTDCVPDAPTGANPKDLVDLSSYYMIVLHVDDSIFYRNATCITNRNNGAPILTKEAHFLKLW